MKILNIMLFSKIVIKKLCIAYIEKGELHNLKKIALEFFRNFLVIKRMSYTWSKFQPAR